jgi:hypothetical protein
MNWHARLRAIERRLLAGAFGGVCRGCGRPGPDSRPRDRLTDADLEVMRSIYAAAAQRRSAGGPGLVVCPRCGEPQGVEHQEFLTSLTDEELDRVGDIVARADGRFWPATPEELEAEIAALEAELAQEGAMLRRRLERLERVALARDAPAPAGPDDGEAYDC